MSIKTNRKKIAGNYKVKDPISNFRLRVKIAQEKPLLAELLENEEDTRDSNFLKEEDRVFKWNEKVFSTFEVKFYGDPKNCITDHQKEYNDEITEKNIEGSQLYTYTATDPFYTENQLLIKPYRSHLSIRNQNALPILQNRKPFNERYNKAIVDNAPTDTRIRSNHYLYTEYSRMYVIADLSRRDEALVTTKDDLETVLCTVTYDCVHKILTIDPDVTDDRCYTVVNSSGIRFNYWIEDVSQKQSPQELQKEKKNLEQEIKQQLAVREATMPHGLYITPPNIRKVFLTMDIQSASNFDYNGLFVMYFLDLPQNWHTNDKERLFGRTQRCKLQNKTAYFGYACDIALECDLNDVSYETGCSPLYPRLLLSAASLDSWTRYRTEGYAVLPVPLSTGSYTFDIKTWRPRGGIVNTLRRFFTGGTYELEDITYCGIPSTHTGKSLKKENLNVVPSGSLQLKINVIHQDHPLIGDSLHSINIHQLGTDTFMSNIEAVFEEFKAARERMLKLRSSNF